MQEFNLAFHSNQLVLINDYCGPITVKERTGRTKKMFKAYVAVFICMNTKAVHLDLVTDLTTDAFMACLSRLIALRGSNREIFKR